jgi:hypothetical protein
VLLPRRAGTWWFIVGLRVVVVVGNVAKSRRNFGNICQDILLLRPGPYRRRSTALWIGALQPPVQDWKRCQTLSALLSLMKFGVKMSLYVRNSFVTDG